MLYSNYVNKLRLGNTVSNYPAMNRLSPRLVAELAANLEPKEAILDRYSIDRAEWDTLRTNPVFIEMLKEAVSDWQHASNADKRVKVKSSIAVEESIATLHGMIRDTDIPPSSRVESFKQLMRLGKLDTPETDTPAAGNGFSITINLGENHKERIVTSTPALLELE